MAYLILLLRERKRLTFVRTLTPLASMHRPLVFSSKAASLGISLSRRELALACMSHRETVCLLTPKTLEAQTPEPRK